MEVQGRGDSVKDEGVWLKGNREALNVAGEKTERR